MKIASIESYRVTIPLKPERKMVSALGRHDVSKFVLVRVTTTDELVGVGEATVTPQWSGETVWGAKAVIDNVFAPVLLGCDPCNIDEIDRRMQAVAVDNWFSKAAIEMACWDIAGRFEGKPVYELLGGACRRLTIRNRFSMGAYEPAIAARRASERVAAGFDTIKVKVGTNPATDVQRVRAVRQAIGSDLTLTIDANGGWDYAQAVDCLQQMSDCHVELVEQPLPRGNYTQLKSLRRETGAKILADESCFDEVEARELIEQECCDALTVYPGKHGGIARARRIAELAAVHDIPCVIGSNLEWDVGTAAMLHFIVATENLRVETYPGDCLGPFYHTSSIAKNPLQIEGPLTTLHDLPGLGIDVDWSAVKNAEMSN